MKIKICGLRSVEAARTAKDGGADFLGFILWPKSRRYVEPETAAKIIREIRDAHGETKTVGVLVDEELYAAERIIKECGFDMTQLHGHEPPGYAEALREETGVKIIKAFRWRDDFSAEAAKEYPADYVLLDTFKKGMVGGTGEAFRWREAAEEMKRLNKPLFLAGGISKENAKEAADILKPFALDVSGSLEEDGEKSPRKIEEFLQVISELRKEETS